VASADGCWAKDGLARNKASIAEQKIIRTEEFEFIWWTILVDGEGQLRKAFSSHLSDAANGVEADIIHQASHRKGFRKDVQTQLG